MSTENNSNNGQNERKPVYEEKRRPPSFGRIFWGVVFIAAAAAIVLNNLDFLQIPGIGFISFIVLVVMVIILIASIPRLFWFGVFFPLAVIYWIVMNSLGYNMENFGVWPVVLIALLLSIGFSILFHRRKTTKPWKDPNTYAHMHYYQPDYTYQNDTPDDGSDDDPNAKYKHIINDPDGSNVYAGTKFGYAIKYINTDNLERGLLEVSAGTMKVYFDNAKIPSGVATVALRVGAGSMELYIPRTWIVVHQYANRLSGIDVRGTPEPAENAPHLILTGEINISSLTVFYV
ncbi:MAG: hypothetical protein FWF33_03370 [Clostridiales bacterium]|nr:hypothetical protein [Clostridiales bacterium]